MCKRFIFVFSLLLILLISTGGLAADIAATGILYTMPVESVLFKHQDHVQKGTSCNTCHSGLFEMEALSIQKYKDFNMNSLYKGKYCGACHNGRKAFASDKQCARCHLGSGVRAPAQDIPAYKNSVHTGKGGKGVVFNHASHLKQAVCRSCHPALFMPREGAGNIKMADHGQNKFCFACHNGKKAFAYDSCNRCHPQMSQPKKIIRFGKGEREVAFRHETHAGKLKCNSCHTKYFGYKAGAAKVSLEDHSDGKTCFVCHQENGRSFYDCNRCHGNN